MSRPEESEQQRLARNVSELLQELRVAQAGVQILFGFLLSVAFTDRFLRATAFERIVHLSTVVLAAAATALLTSPAAWHRLLFRLGRRDEIVDRSNRFALLGLGCLALAMTGAVLLLVDVVVGFGPALVVGALTGLLFGFLWFLLPLRARMRATAEADQPHQATDQPRKVHRRSA
ncbi:DUF6328 family protein [Goodfellowiella coeruleoviolacea]|uniref:Uncharacterized protein n=1 Tax=Goodfellowiella coeruleoviolacea TaxID=334858 RepID=A0AAE3KH42_9PSEU|nr:DUF6328 family protein [Goodfellowiella coeruleoviolacea]MCP2166084.1 hypothetical protein [Goodfellowiella coeruleoviolacea]